MRDDAPDGALAALGLALAPCLVGWPILGVAGARIWRRAAGAPVSPFVPLLALLDLALAGALGAAGAAAAGVPAGVGWALAAAAPVARSAVAWPHPAPPAPATTGVAPRLAAAGLWWGPVLGAAAGVASATAPIALVSLLAFGVAFPIGVRRLAAAGAPSVAAPGLVLGHRVAGVAAGALLVAAGLSPSPLRPSGPPAADAIRGDTLALGDATAELRGGRARVASPHGDGAGALPIPGGAAAEALALTPAAGSRGATLHVRAGGRWYATRLDGGARLDDGPGARLRAHAGVPGGAALFAWVAAPLLWAGARRRGGARP